MTKDVKKENEISLASSKKEEKVEQEEVYCFPDYGISIKAKSREEAEKKLKEILKEK